MEESWFAPGTWGAAVREYGVLCGVVALALGVALGVALALGDAFVWLRARYWHFVSWRRDTYHSAWRHLHGGRPHEAEREFREVLWCFWGPKRLSVRMALCLCRLAQCEFRAALVLLKKLERSWLLRCNRCSYEQVPGAISLCLALLGDTAEAKRWLAEGHRRERYQCHALLLPEAIILCREGHSGAAVRLIEENLGYFMWGIYPFYLANPVRAYALSAVDARRFEQSICYAMRYLGESLGPYQATLVACWPALGPLLERWKCCMNPTPRKNEDGLIVGDVFDCEHGK